MFICVLLCASVFLLYISYIKCKDLAESITGIHVNEIGEDVKAHIKYAIHNIDMEDISFIQYIVISLKSFSYSVIELHSARIKDIVTQSLSTMLIDFTAVAERTCLPRSKIITEGLYTISSVYTGNLDLGKTLNTFIQTATVISTPSTTGSCITNTALSLQKRAIEEMFHQRNLLLNQLNAQTSQSIHFFIYGISLSSSSVIYLLYRSKCIVGFVYKQIRS